MNLAIEKLPECRAKLSAEVPANTVETTRAGVVDSFMSQANIPGFRPGKLPRKVVEKKFGDRIENELKERLARSVIKEAIDIQKLNLLGISKVEREVFESDGTYSFVYEVVIKPEVDITEEEYKGIPIEVTKQEVTEEMVNEWLKNVQANFTTFTDTEGAIDFGDRAMITYSATKDGKPLAEELPKELALLAHREEPFELMIPKENETGFELIPGVSSGIVGLKAGESKEIEVNFEEEHFLPDLKGLTATYSVKVESVKKAELPPIDDALARKLGVESLEAMKVRYTTEVKAQFERDKIQQIENQILEKINKEHQFDLPEEQVLNETQYHVNQMVKKATQEGMGQEDIAEHKQEIVDSATSRAIANLRTRYILDVIAKKEKITVSEDDLTRYVVGLAQRAKKPVKKYARELRDGPGFDAIRGDILISKTIAFLRENATVTEVENKSEEPKEEDSAD